MGQAAGAIGETLLWLFHTTRDSEAVPVCFHCPGCGERDVQGCAWTEFQRTSVLGLVQVLEERLYWVQGPCCERKLLSRLPPKELTELEADAIADGRVLKDRIPVAGIALLVMAYLFFCVPALAPFFLLLAWLAGGGAASRPGFRLACRVCLILHLIAVNAFALSAVVSAPQP